MNYLMVFMFLLGCLIKLLLAHNNQTAEVFAKQTLNGRVLGHDVLYAHHNPYDWKLVLCILLPIAIFLLIVTSVFCIASYMNESLKTMAYRIIACITCVSDKNGRNILPLRTELVNVPQDIPLIED
ncbi:hypothetical protein ILUMI_09829 [Ignelater luminosus]|uniref:Uncharacterized protein n=1 Tax=Ignelater luminosus TaxID=2038154 RepID=A0A8K0D366_IGNLU|nr:hypothetical protein ILUMI_09829 [Ignelater luminosus]